MKPKICARFLCKNEVVLPRIKYCSKKCCEKGSRDLYRAKNMEKIRNRQRKYDIEHPEQVKKRILDARRITYLKCKLPKWMYS